MDRGRCGSRSVWHSGVLRLRFAEDGHTGIGRHKTPNLVRLVDTTGDTAGRHSADRTLYGELEIANKTPNILVHKSMLVLMTFLAHAGLASGRGGSTEARPGDQGGARRGDAAGGVADRGHVLRGARREAASTLRQGIPTDGAVDVQWGAEHSAVGEARRRGVRGALGAELAYINVRAGGRNR